MKKKKIELSFSFFSLGMIMRSLRRLIYCGFMDKRERLLNGNCTLLILFYDILLVDLLIFVYYIVD